LKSTDLPQAAAKGSIRNVCFLWPPLEAALSIPKVSFFVKKSFEKSLKKETAISA
jgi:hypothetical protein